ncbi:hypothetical protein ACQHIV_08775 [Kribbella sp. GL6]|uniref:hypothetical protein n=1 Tax=Kribbella sp. GL6 TaxID=3419765 RepID=UPI003D06573A
MDERETVTGTRPERCLRQQHAALGLLDPTADRMPYLSILVEMIAVINQFR